MSINNYVEYLLLVVCDEFDTLLGFTYD